MTKNDFKAFAVRLKKLSVDYDFGRDAIVGILFTNKHGKQQIAVQLTKTVDISEFADVLGEEVETGTVGDKSAEYFNHGNIQFAKLVEEES